MDFEKIPSLIAVATFAALCVIVAHEWGYFGVLGADFQYYFTTYDYTSELIVFFGPSFVVVLLIAALQAAVLRSESSSKWPTAKTRFGKLFAKFFGDLVLVAYVVAFWLFLDQTNLAWLYMAIAFVYLRIATFVSGIRAFAETAIGLVVIILPAVMIGAYGFGRDSAYEDLQSTKYGYRLRLKNRAFDQPVKLLRLLDKGALVTNAGSRTIAFYPREEIVSLERVQPEWETRSFACLHWGWAC